MEQNPTKKCSQCQKDVDLKATRCPYCRADLRSWARRHPIGVLIIVSIIAPIIMSQIGEPQTYSSQTPAVMDFTGMKKAEIESASRSYVRDTLKAPSTAKFNLFPSIKEDPKVPNLFTVISHVDSQNSFGAMIRSSWEIKVMYVGSDTEADVEDWSKYKIVEYYFDGERVK